VRRKPLYQERGKRSGHNNNLLGRKGDQEGDSSPLWREGSNHRRPLKEEVYCASEKLGEIIYSLPKAGGG